MREIKFRGKRVDNGEWVYGSLLNDSDGIPKDIWFYTERLISYVSVHPETVGQFTGLKDKNGVDIYEGDLISYGDDPTHPVEWNKSFSCWTCWEEDFFDFDSCLLKHIHSSQYIIQGNIHDKTK